MPCGRLGLLPDDLAHLELGVVGDDAGILKAIDRRFEAMPEIVVAERMSRPVGRAMTITAMRTRSAGK